MKKNVIALLLAVVMASSSVGSIPVVAAETAASETVIAEETAAEEENAPGEESVEGATAADVTEAADEAATDDGGSAESVQDQNTESESEALDEEQETVEEDDTEESSGPNDYNPDEVESQEAAPETSSENELTADQIRAFQKKINIWKYDNQITIVYDSSEDAKISYHLYSVKDGELLYEGNLHRIEENGLYYEAVDFDAVNEAENRGTNEIDITDISVKAVIEVAAEQGDENSDRNVNSFEEVVSDDTGIVSIAEVDTETDGKITAKWDCTEGGETDGYSIIVRSSDANGSVHVYDTDRLTDNVDDDAYTLDADHQITLNSDKESVSEITVAAYRLDDTGVKYYGSASSRIIAEDEDQSTEEAADSDTVSKDSMKGVIASGTVGEALNWAVYDDGKLRISGTWGQYDSDRPWKNYSFNEVIIEPGITRIGNSAFMDCGGVTSVTIPNTVTSIDHQAFRGCKNLTGVTIPSSVTEIGGWVFYGCTNLASVTFSGGLTFIGDKAFYGCTELKSVALPNGLKTISGSAFYGCSGLTDVTIPDSVTSMEYSAFMGCSSLTEVTLPKNLTCIEYGTFSGCTSLTDVTIPDGVTSIGEYVFYGCKALTEVTLPGSVTSIGSSTFANCTELRSIVIPSGVTAINISLFSGCTSLTSVTIPSGVSIIDSFAFLNCTSLAEIVIPGGVKIIAYQAFKGCTNLKTVTIPKSVTKIVSSAFNACNNLEVVYYYGTNSDWDAISIENGNDPLLNARRVFVDGSSSIVLSSEFTCFFEEPKAVTATYVSNQNVSVTVSVKSDAGSALELSSVSVLGPFEANSLYESYISFTITGKMEGEYNLTLTASDGSTAKTVIKVEKYDISKARIKLNCPDLNNGRDDCVVHTGSEVEPDSLEVKAEDKLLTRGKDYTVSYSSNINYGKATATVSGIGKYKGQKTAEFYIVPEKVTNLDYCDTACGHNKNNNVGAKHRALEVKWDARKGLAGYIIEFSEDPTLPEESREALKADAKEFKKENLKRDTVYYVRVTPYIMVGTDTIFGVMSDVFEYKTCNHLIVKDFWGFGNIGRKMPEEFYRIFFSPAQADQFNKNDKANGTSGFCFGMTHFALLILCKDGYPELKDFAVSSLYDIKSFDQISLVRNGIYLVRTMEKFGRYREKNEVGTFYEWVSQYTSGERSQVTFIVSNGNEGHCLVALDIVEKTTAKVKVLVYDPNYPGKERYLYLYADKNDGNYTRWSYDTGFFVIGKLEGKNGDTKGDYIRLVNDKFVNNTVYYYYNNYHGNGDTPEEQEEFIDRYNNWLISLQENNSSTNFSEFVNNEIQKKNNAISIENSNESGTEETDGNTRFYWVPKKTDNTIELEGVPAGVEIHLAGNKHAVTLTTPVKCDLSITLPDTGEGEVKIFADEDTEVQVVFYDYDDDGDVTKTSYSASGNAETPIDIVKNQDDDSDAPLYSGTCGSNLTWSFDESGILRISGTGAMYDYGLSSNKAPWLKPEIMNSLKSVIIKNGVTKIGDYAFTICYKSTSVWIPNSVVSIGNYAFSACRGLEKVTIPEGVTSIGLGAFNDCSGIDTIKIPSSVESIGNMAFSGCTSLNDITVNSDNATYSAINGILFNKDGTELICCPAGKKGLYSIPDGVVKIGAFAFNGCSGLTGVSIPDGVSKIDGYAFGGCSGLTSIAIPSSVTDIMVNACNNCSKLSQIYFIGTQEEWNSININSINSVLLAVRKIFVDDPKSLSYAEVPEISNMEYTGRAIKPKFEVHQLCTLLERGKDYTVSYSDNVNAGTVTVTISGAGEYTGSVTASFVIDPKPISSLEVSGITAKTFNGKAQTQAIVVNDGIVTLVEGIDYDVAYENNVHAGTASVVITGKGNYTGTVTKTFTIKKASNTITAKNFTKTYSTKAQSFSLGVKLKNGTPTYKSSTKYVTVSTAGKVTVKAKYIGKATITITSPEKANYSKQTKKITITVNPTKTALVSVASPSAGKMTVKWKKNAVGTGYQIQFSTSSKFTSPKSATITKNTTLSKTIGGLVKGKKYYVRIRTYKTVGKTKFYSGWSAVKAVTIKK